MRWVSSLVALASLVSLSLLACGRRKQEPKAPSTSAAGSVGQRAGAVAAVVDPLVAEALASGKHQGLYLGVIVDGQPWWRGYGQRSQGDPRPPDERTLFEIASVTKVFTTALALQLERAGELSLQDQAQKHFPVGLRAPTHEGRGFTLEQLATHTSGLPRLAGNHVAYRKDPANPYAAYTRDALWAFLDGLQLSRAPGERAEYSNLGVGLLGELLSLRAGKSYEALLRERVLEPLGMADTAVTLTPEQRERLAPGHLLGQPVPGWDMAAMSGAGGLRSSGADMLRFLSANLGAGPPAMTELLAATQVVRHTDASGERSGLGWSVQPVRKTEALLHWHNGGSGGYSSFLGFVAARQLGVVLLGNSATDELDGLAAKVLRALLDLAPGATRG